MDRGDEPLWPQKSPDSPRPRSYRSYADAQTDRITGYLFPNVERHAHEIVQYTTKTVEKLEVLFEHYGQEENPEIHKVQHILDLLFYFTAKKESGPINERRQKVFRYLAAALIYARIMMKSFENSKIYLDSLSETIQDNIFRQQQGQSPYPHPRLSKSSILPIEENVKGAHASDTPNNSGWFVPKEMIIDIFFLDRVAEQIKDELTDYSYVKRSMDKLEESDEPLNRMLREHHLSRYGRLASNECVGNTPFLIVHKGKRTEVSIRRGFELYRPQHPESEAVKNFEMKLSEFPTRVLRNEGQFDNILDETLFSIVGKDEGLARTLFEESHISEIHIKVTDGLVTINIDIIDQKLEGDISSREWQSENLEKLTGRQYRKGNESCSLQEDLFVTVFAHILFTHKDPYEQRQLQAFEDWSLEEIQSFTEESKIYIGFCFGTLLDVGYTQPVGATGSRNTLLLALARGFIKLYGNLTIERLHWEPEAREDFENNLRERSSEHESEDPDLPDTESSSKRFLNFLRPAVPAIVKIFDTVNKYRKRIMEVEVDQSKLPVATPKEGMLLEVIKNRKIVNSQGHYLGSTAKGIVIKIEHSPIRLIWVWSLIAVGIFGFPYTYWPNKSESQDWREFFRAVGSILELWGALFAWGFLAVKYNFRQWTLTDMFNNRKGCQSLGELIKVIKYSEKRKWFANYLKKKRLPEINPWHVVKIGEMPKKYFKRYKWNRAYKKLENRRRAIQLCATLPNPQQILSYHNSCAFSVTGEGEFEIDDAINVWDLHGVNYWFGVNYHGDPIVKDA